MSLAKENAGDILTGVWNPAIGSPAVFQGLSQERFYGWGISVAALGIIFRPAFANIPPSDMQCHG